MTPLYAGVGGVVRELTEMDAGVNGVVKPMTEMWAGVDGVNRQIFGGAVGNIYGAEWDGSSNPKWTRTDAAADFPDPNPAVNNGTGSSPFDDIMPWAGIKVENETQAGTLVNVWVKIPKYYYKWTRTGSSMKLQISPDPQDGFFVSPAHADREDGVGERDVVYVGRYHTVYYKWSSLSGATPMINKTRAECRDGIHGTKNIIWQYDFAMYWTIMMLYLVEFANWDSQAMIGYGCSPNGSIFNTGLTDSMLYHTGTTAANRTTYGCCQYRHIEGLWDNVYDWVDGIYFSGANVYCTKNPANFRDTSGGTLVGKRATANGFISTWTNPEESGFEHTLYPNKTGATSNTYVCDYALYGASGIVLYAGGSYGHTQNSGAFFLNGYSSGSTSAINIGCRLMKLP